MPVSPLKRSGATGTIIHKNHKHMCAQKTPPRGLLSNIVSNQCPACREGKLFSDPNPYHLKHVVDMPAHCPVCGQPYELQTGFYFGTGYVAYAISVLIIGISFVLWYFTIGFSISDNRIYYWLLTSGLFLVLIQPPLQRLCRSLWISFFVRYNPNWEHPQETTQQ